LGQKVHPYGFRIGTLYGWQSNWFAERRYAEDHETIAFMANDAARRALDDAGLTPGDVDAIVVGTASDSDNVFITLSAREKNPAIRIHARGESDGGLRRLRLAGADQALSAYHMGGLRIAASILRPSVVDFLEIAAPGRGEEVDLEEIRLSPGSPMVGAAIGMVEQRHDRLRIVALKRDGEPIRLVPPPGTEVRDGDHLVVIGARRSLEDLAQLAQGRPARVS